MSRFLSLFSSRFESRLVLSKALAVARESDLPCTERTPACLKRKWTLKRANVRLLAYHLQTVLDREGYKERVFFEETDRSIKLIQHRDFSTFHKGDSVHTFD